LLCPGSIFVAVALLALAGAACSSGGDSNADGWADFTANGFEIRLPDQFEGGVPTAAENEAILRVAREIGTDEQLQQLRDSIGYVQLSMVVPGGSASVNVALRDAHAGVSFEASMAEEESLATQACDCTVSREWTRIAGLQAFRLTYSTAGPFGAGTTTQYFVLAKNKVWIVSYSCFTSCDHYIPIFDESASSIRLVE
jgi:hypothetical protein